MIISKERKISEPFFFTLCIFLIPLLVSGIAAVLLQLLSTDIKSAHNKLEMLLTFTFLAINFYPIYLILGTPLAIINWFITSRTRHILAIISPALLVFGLAISGFMEDAVFLRIALAYAYTNIGLAYAIWYFLRPWILILAHSSLEKTTDDKPPTHKKTIIS
jgi:hypothetical protein